MEFREEEQKQLDRLTLAAHLGAIDRRSFLTLFRSGDPMFRLFQRPIRLVLFLAFFTAIPVLNSLVQVFQIPSGTYPRDSAHLAVAPISWFAHVLAGVAFGITGPAQFVRALRHRFGALHRVLGRMFVLSGATIGLSGLSILAQVTSQRTPLVDIARGLFGLALLIALALAMAAIRDRDFLRHRAWAIRAYAVGMGLGTVALVFFPIYIVTGQAPIGLASDILFIASWVLTIAFAEVVIRHSSRSVDAALQTAIGIATGGAQHAASAVRRGRNDHVRRR